MKKPKINKRYQVLAELLIKSKNQQIDQLKNEINQIAFYAIPDFHFLDHRVSTFWKCEKSPIGYCVFFLDLNGREMLCRYCAGPKERK